MNETEKIINQIEKIRIKNNKNWMAILKLCFKSNPEEAKKIFNKIAKNDKIINELSGKLG